MDWDVFISHAWEDKEDIARPLAEALRRKGLRVWYDEFTVTLGDSLRRSIDRGLAQSRYGVVILSPNFFAKEWPQKELDGLAAREVGSGKVIFPVWHNVAWEDVRRFSPTFTDKLAVSTAKGLDAVVEEILRALRVDLESESTGEERRPMPLPVVRRAPAKPPQDRLEEAITKGKKALADKNFPIAQVFSKRALEIDGVLMHGLG